MNLNVLLPLISNPALRLFFLVVPALIALDFATGVAKAFRQRDFRTAMLGDFVHNNFVPYLLLVLGVAGAVVGGAPVGAAVASFLAATTALAASQLGSIVENLGALTGFPDASIEAIVSSLFNRVAPEATNAQVPAVAPSSVVSPAVDTPTSPPAAPAA